MQIHGGNAAQPDVLLRILEVPAQIHNLCGIHDERRLTEGFLGFEHCGVIHFVSPFFRIAQSSAPFFHT